MPRLTAIAIVLAAAVGVSPRAHAAVESELVRQGLAAYNDLEYAKAIDLLHKALRETLTQEEKVITYQTLAFAHVAQDRRAEARADFKHLLAIDSSFELDRTISPRVRAVFEEAKAAVAVDWSRPDQMVVTLAQITPEVEPARPKQGQPITLSVPAHAAAGAAKLELFYRTRGQRAYSRMMILPLPAGGFEAPVPGLQVEKPALEYHMVLLDGNGASLARAGALGQPLVIEVEGRPRPVYTKLWFWSVLGGVAAAGAAVAVVLAVTSSSSTVAPGTPATVTLTPR